MDAIRPNIRPLCPDRSREVVELMPNLIVESLPVRVDNFMSIEKLLDIPSIIIRTIEQLHMPFDLWLLVQFVCWFLASPHQIPPFASVHGPCYFGSVSPLKDQPFLGLSQHLCWFLLWVPASASATPGTALSLTIMSLRRGM